MPEQVPYRQESWVIDIPDVGEVEFPETMSEEQVTRAVQQLHNNATAQPLPTLPGRLFHLTGRDQPNPALVSDQLGEVAPYAGGILGGLAGTATAGPLGGVAGAGIGAAMGTAAKAGFQGQPRPTNDELLKAGAGSAVGQATGTYLVGPLVGAAGKYVADKAVPLVQSAIKPTVTTLKQQAGASMTGLNAQSKRLAGILVKNKFTKPEQAASAVQAAESELQGVLSGAGDVALDTAERVPRYLGSLERSAGKQLMPSHDVNTIKAASGQVLKGPLAEDAVETTMQPSPSGLVDEFGQPFQVPVKSTTRAMRTDVAPAEGLDMARATGRWGNRKAWGELKGAEQEASKTAERAVRDSVKAAVPAAKPILQKQGDALKSFQVLDRMATREGNRDAIGLPAWVMAAGGSGTARTVGAALANYVRNNQLSLGMRASELGPALMKGAGRTGAISGEALKAALIALLSTDETAPPMQP